MIDLGLNQYKIKEIKYEVKENKIVTFKLRNFNLEDVTIEEIDKKELPIEESDYQQFSEAKDYKKVDKQYEIDKTIIDENEAVKDKKINDNFNKLSKVYAKRCKELIGALDKMPYKAIEKIGSLDILSNGKGNDIRFYPEPDPYVVNDERELPKQKMPSLTTDEKSTIEASKKKEWKDSMKNEIRTKPIIAEVDLDKKYKDMSTDEKREVSKKLIEKDAKEDSKIIKERVENSIGNNTPLSEEVLKYPEKDFLKDKILDINDNE